MPAPHSSHSPRAVRRPAAGPTDGLREPVMALSLTCDGPGSVVSVSGEVDMRNAHLLTELVEFLCRRPAPLIVLDLAEVSFFGAHGISALLQAHELVTAGGGRLTVRDPSPFVLSLLGVSGLLRHLELRVALGLARSDDPPVAPPFVPRSRPGRDHPDGRPTVEGTAAAQAPGLPVAE